MQVEDVQIVRFRHALERVRVRDQGCALGADARVVVRVVPVPVRIDREFQGSVAEIVERLLESVPRQLRERIHDQLAVRTVQDDHVPSRPGQQRELVREFHRFDRNARESRPSFRQPPGRLCARLPRQPRRRARKGPRETVRQRPSASEGSRPSQNFPPRDTHAPPRRDCESGVDPVYRNRI